MQMLKWLRNDMIGLTIIVSAGAAFYYLVLTDEARASLNKAVGTIVNSYGRVSGVIEDVTGIVMEEEEPFLSNRESVIAQWKNLGF